MQVSTGQPIFPTIEFSSSQTAMHCQLMQVQTTHASTRQHTWQLCNDGGPPSHMNCWVACVFWAVLILHVGVMTDRSLAACWTTTATMPSVTHCYLQAPTILSGSSRVCVAHSGEQQASSPTFTKIAVVRCCLNGWPALDLVAVFLLYSDIWYWCILYCRVIRQPWPGTGLKMLAISMLSSCRSAGPGDVILTPPDAVGDPAAELTAAQLANQAVLAARRAIVR